MTNQTDQANEKAKEIAESLFYQVTGFVEQASPKSLLKLMTWTTGGLICAQLNEDGDATLIVFGDEGMSRNVFDLDLGGLIRDDDNTLQDMRTYAEHWGVELPATLLADGGAYDEYDEWFLQSPAAQAGARRTLLEELENVDLGGVADEMLALSAEDEQEED